MHDERWVRFHQSGSPNSWSFNKYRESEDLWHAEFQIRRERKAQGSTTKMTVFETMHLASLKSLQINNEMKAVRHWKRKLPMEHLMSQSQEAVGIQNLPGFQIEGNCLGHVELTVWCCRQRDCAYRPLDVCKGAGVGRRGTLTAGDRSWLVWGQEGKKGPLNVDSFVLARSKIVVMMMMMMEKKKKMMIKDNTSSAMWQAP